MKNPWKVLHIPFHGAAAEACWGFCVSVFSLVYLKHDLSHLLPSAAAKLAGYCNRGDCFAQRQRVSNRKSVRIEISGLGMSSSGCHFQQPG